MDNAPAGSPAPGSARYVDVSVRDHVVSAAFRASAVGTQETPVIAEEIISAMNDEGERLQHLVLDLSGVTFMNSSGLGMCIELRNRADAHGAKTSVVGMHANLMEVFVLMKVDRLFQIVSGGS